MARITVEDCLDNVDNRFQLVLAASMRARQLANGAEARVEWENDKPTVVALREIADGLTGLEVLDEESRQKRAASTIDEAQIVAELQAELRAEAGEEAAGGAAMEDEGAE